MADPAAHAGHAGHDPLLVAEAVDRGARLASVLDLCARCVALYVDLVALTGALPRSALPARPRDLTLTAEEARRLRPGGWRGLWSAVGSARDTLTRPLAIGITTMGLAGLLLTVAPTLFLGVGGASIQAAPEMAPAAASLPPSERTVGAAAGDPADPTWPSDPAYRMSTAPSAEGLSPTLLLSVGLLLVGGSLFTVRRIAVRSRPVR